MGLFSSSALPIIIAKYRRLLERCTGIAEAKGSNPVQACFFKFFFFFQAFFSQPQNLKLLPFPFERWYACKR